MAKLGDFANNFASLQLKVCAMPAQAWAWEGRRVVIIVARTEPGSVPDSSQLGNVGYEVVYI